MIPLTNRKNQKSKKTKFCCIFKKRFEHKYTNDKNYCKVRNHCHYTGKHKGAAHSICNLIYSIPK